MACFASHRHGRTPLGDGACGDGAALLFPPGDREAVGASNNASVTLPPKAIERAAAMAGSPDGRHGPERRWWAFQPLAFPPGAIARHLHVLIHSIDACAAVDTSLPV